LITVLFEMKSNWRIYFDDWFSGLGLVIFLLLLITALIGPVLAPFDPQRVGIGPGVTPPEITYLMGTDELGRDVFSRAVSGIRVSLFVGVMSALIATCIGVFVGSLAGFWGGLVDHALMRVTEVFQVIPAFFLAVVLVALFGTNVFNIVFAISVLSWPIIARITRSEFLSLRSRQYVDAARLSGASNARLIFGEILPNASGPIIVSATLLVGRAILIESGLSFLGLGDINRVSLGVMLYQSRPYVQFAWWIAMFPGMLIFLAVLSTNLIGDGLNDVMKPRFAED
jgi:peptide/nickel transport system permease protein